MQGAKHQHLRSSAVVALDTNVWQVDFPLDLSRVTTEQSTSTRTQTMLDGVLQNKLLCTPTYVSTDA